MTRENAILTAISAPSVGPTILIVFGLKLPIAALALSLVGLLLARYVKPRSASNLTARQELALTLLLSLILVVIVAGEFPMLGDGEPLGVGMATAWGIGLGTSGIVAVDLVGARVLRLLRAAFGEPPGPNPPEG